MKRKRLLICIACCFQLLYAVAQQPQNVGIGTTNPHSSAILDITSNTKGLLVPRMTDAEMRTISSPAIGLIVLNVDDTSLYMNRDTGWAKIVSASGDSKWLANGSHLYNSNAGNVGIGTDDPSNARLQITDAVGATVAMFGSNKFGTTINADNPGIGFNYFYNGSSKTIKAGYAGLLEMNPGDGSMYFGNFNSNQSGSDLGDISGFQPVLTMKQNGAIGVGNPAYYDGKLNIKGDNGIYLTGASDNLFGRMLTDNNGNFIINSQSSDALALLKRDILLNPFIDFTTDQYRGNVGIHTSNTSHAILEVADVEGATVAMFGNNKFGTTVNADNPGIGLNYFFNGTSKTIKPGYAGLIEMNRFNGDIYIGNFNGNQSSANYGNISGYQNTFLIKQNGNVGIGTDNPTYKLAVNGNIRSKEVVVESGWADYVFEKNYNLIPLSEVEKFIHDNKRLPNIPSAEEIESNGLNLGDVQTKMMQKIEELTLYVIELKKEIETLKAKQ